MDSPQPRQGAARSTALALLAVVLLLPAAVPLLDRDLQVERPAVEARHHVGVCIPLHDHTLCTAVGSHRILARPRLALSVSETQRHAACPRCDVTPRAASRAGSLRPRAPPLG